MIRNDFIDLLETNELLFSYGGTDYQICFVNGKVLAGLAEDESQDFWFDTVDEMLDNWKLNGTLLKDALPHIVC